MSGNLPAEGRDFRCPVRYDLEWVVRERGIDGGKGLEPMAPGGSNRLLRYAEAAKYLNMPESTLRQNWRRYGLTAHRIGPSVMFRERELERWIESRAERAA